jgi:nitrite reductase (NO-forming)
MGKTLHVHLIISLSFFGLLLVPSFFVDQMLQPQAFASTAGGQTREFVLIADEVDIQIAPDNALFPGGVTYRAMVFNGTTPGPVIAVNQGDTFAITLVNEGDVIHSLVFQAGYGPSAAVGAQASQFGSSLQPGESVRWTFEASTAGAFLYYCGADGLNGVWEHVANGMYGGMVVHASNEQPAKEFYLVFGEIYSDNVDGIFTQANGTGGFDVAQFLSGNPDIVMTNGMAHKYVPTIGTYAQIDLNPNAEVFQVQPGELTRWYIFNAGPRNDVAFNFISGKINVSDGSISGQNYLQVLPNGKTWNIPTGSASIIETEFPEEGIYVGVDHDFGRMLIGGMFAVLATPDSTADDHPAGTFVPPRNNRT